MDHFVTLERLPQGFEVPPAYAERVQYDPVKHRLLYRGFMSKIDFDRLCALSDDWDYRRQVEELFRQCTPEASALRRGFGGLLGPLSKFGLF